MEFYNLKLYIFMVFLTGNLFRIPEYVFASQKYRYICMFIFPLNEILFCKIDQLNNNFVWLINYQIRVVYIFLTVITNRYSNTYSMIIIANNCASFWKWNYWTISILEHSFTMSIICIHFVCVEKKNFLWINFFINSNNFFM